MKKYKLQKIAPYLLISTMLLTGCSNSKQVCEKDNSHVHLYTQNIDGAYITTYYPSEEEDIYGFEWHPETIRIEDDELEAYKLLQKYGLFNGLFNWNYLYNEISRHKDYMQYYYEYNKIEPYYNEAGEKVGEKLVPHQGWTNSYKDDHLTGLCRVCHHRYYSFKLIKLDGHYALQRSPLVDDIRDVLEEYPYVLPANFEIVCHDIELTPDLMRRLDADSFTFFEHPDYSEEDARSLTLSK